MSSMVKMDEGNGMATPNFFNSAWNPEQSDFSFTDNYQGDLGNYDSFAPNQNYQMGNGNNESMDYFSGHPEPHFQQNFTSGYQHDPVNDDVGRILTPGLSFLSMDMETETDIKQYPGLTSYPAPSQAPSTQGMQPYVPGSLVFGPNGLAALPGNQWTSEVEPHISKGRTFIENSSNKKTIVTHGQVTPGDSPPDGDELAAGKKSISFLSTEINQKEEARSAIGKRAATIKPEAGPMEEDITAKPAKKPRKSKKKPITKDQEEAKRKRFLERNRVAADKCRQNRKKWIDDLQDKCHRYSADNAVKKAALEEMGQEIMHLKNMLLMHSQTCKDDKILAWVNGEANKPAVTLSNQSGEDISLDPEQADEDVESSDSEQNLSPGSTIEPLNFDQTTDMSPS